MVALRYAVIGLAVLAILWPSEPPQALTHLAGSEWRVVEIGGRKAAAGTVRFTQTSVRGKAACNSFMGPFRETSGAIEIGDLGVTRMLCEGRMELERIFVDALARAKFYRVEDGVLVLLDAASNAILKLSA